jgi:hypothetical protein
VQTIESISEERHLFAEADRPFLLGRLVRQELGLESGESRNDELLEQFGDEVEIGRGGKLPVDLEAEMKRNSERRSIESKKADKLTLQFVAM